MNQFDRLNEMLEEIHHQQNLVFARRKKKELFEIKEKEINELLEDILILYF